MKAHIIPINHSSKPRRRVLTEADIALYARAMQQDTVDDLPQWLQQAINQNHEYRSWAIDYYLWLEYPQEYSKPLPPYNEDEESRAKNKIKITSILIYSGIAAACLLLLLGIYPFASKYYLQWQQEQYYAANFVENPTREAVFLGVRMNTSGKLTNPKYKLKNLLSSEGKIPTITAMDSFALAWQLVPIEPQPFQPQRVTLQIWDNTQPTPVFKLPFVQTSSLWKKTYSLNIQPGVYYIRLQFDNQVETLAKLKFYRRSI
ncbi:MAG: hypothetical protein RML72_05285 [Bacteroidia bacterium]|nr:hypothetical protein [Bacteroidia bacterium]MDW8158277.1 hypothetical protein [Bacteroidia bacterium]